MAELTPRMKELVQPYLAGIEPYDPNFTPTRINLSANENTYPVQYADEKVCIGPAQATKSYLVMSNIIAAATITGADAIHPGYGFLAENASFAKLCKKYGIAFVGPSGELIDRMGDKDAARRLMKASGVPIIPGSGILENVDEAKKAAKEIGYPVMLKASAGGGGKGIRLVKTEDELEQAFKTASSEAQQAFGDGRMYMEKYIYPAKHIEVQLLCDEQGHVVCLGERECSIQRNNQKLIEESPSPGVTKEKRAELFEAATKAALTEVLPAFDATEAEELTIDEMPITVYTATKEGAVSGYAVQSMTKQGFGGVVRLMVGFTPEGEVVNVNVLEQTETPGLGTKMADEGNVLLASVKGRKLESKKLVDGKLAVTKDGGDVDALTAATISSRAYVDAINRAWMAYKSVATGEAPTDTASGATGAAGQTNEPAAQEGGQNE